MSLINENLHMSIPTYDQFIEPILRYLAARPEGAPAKVAHNAAAEALGITEQERQQLIPSGQPVYKNRAGWAHDRLKRAGLSSSPQRGVWMLTEAGKKFVVQHPAPLSNVELQGLAIGFTGKTPSN
jgi:restriction system protein